MGGCAPKTIGPKLDTAEKEIVLVQDVSADEITPNYNLFIFKKGPREKLYESRADFIRLFYEYAKEFRAGNKASWTEWLKGRARE